jgi:hypothetical protein
MEMSSLFIGSFYIHIHLIIIVWPSWQFTKKWCPHSITKQELGTMNHMLDVRSLTISSVRRALSMQILTRFLAANDQAQGWRNLCIC